MLKNHDVRPPAGFPKGACRDELPMFGRPRGRFGCLEELLGRYSEGTAGFVRRLPYVRSPNVRSPASDGLSGPAPTNWEFDGEPALKLQLRGTAGLRPRRAVQ